MSASTQFKQHQNAGAPIDELVRLIISQQLTVVRCTATPARSGKAGAVDCELPNSFFQLGSGAEKRIKAKMIDVPIGFLNGTTSEFDRITGVILCSNFPTLDIGRKTLADMSCANVTAEKALFIPAVYLDELVKTLTLNAQDKITLGGTMDDIKGVSRIGDEVEITVNPGGTPTSPAGQLVTSVEGGSGAPALGFYAETKLTGTISSGSSVIFAAKEKK